MTHGFMVDMEAMTKLIASVTKSSEHIKGAVGQLNSTSAADFGSAALDSAANEFQGEWDQGIQTLSKAATAVSGKLEAARKSYEKIEQESTEALQRIQNEIGQPSNPHNGDGAAQPEHSALGPSGGRIDRALNGNFQGGNCE